MELLLGILALGIIVVIFVFLLGIIKWLLQGYFLYRVADMKNLDMPVLSFIPFGTFYVAGQDYNGNIFEKGRFNPRTLGAVFVIVGIILYFSGLSIGDIALSYVLMESVAFIGIFKAYTKNTAAAVLLALLNVITVGIAAIIILFLYSRKLVQEDTEPVIYENPVREESSSDK
ncbi:hypothetical protein [Corticicoccus populi]|uniref:Uncharacterized protein n=1 Tax=Corticicoccus populi TaxID=1812821 RepID=A0ABW5WZ94_9STAP